MCGLSCARPWGVMRVPAVPLRRICGYRSGSPADEAVRNGAAKDTGATPHDEPCLSMQRQRAHPQAKEETTMNWNWFRLDWMHFKDEVRDKWRKLTDEDLTRIAGRRAQLIGRLQARYGFAKADAEREAGAWMQTQAAR